MPFPNEHAARLENPNKYDEFRRDNNKLGSGIHAIFGIILKPQRKSELQSIRFDKNKFTVSEAKKWLKDHDFKPISFEPASEKDYQEELIKKEFKFEIKAINEIEDEEKELFVGSFEGLASTFGNLDKVGDIIEQGAFKPAIRKIKKEGRMPKALMQHNPYNEQGAVFTDIKETQEGLYVKGKFINTQRGRDLRIEVKTGAISDFSIGFYIDKFEIDNKRNCRIIKLISELPEISFVTFPANNEANILNAKSKPDNARDLERALRDVGYSQSEAKKIVSDGFKALKNHRDDDNKTVKDFVDSVNKLNEFLKGENKNV